MRPRPRRRLSEDDLLKSAYYQFWLVTFGPLRDTKRWWGKCGRAPILPRHRTQARRDCFQSDLQACVWSEIEQIIRLSKAEESKQTELIQLADVLLGAFSLLVIGERPSSPGGAQLVEHCAAMLGMKPTTQRRLLRLSFESWVPLNSSITIAPGRRRVSILGARPAPAPPDECKGVSRLCAAMVAHLSSAPNNLVNQQAAICRSVLMPLVVQP